MLEHPPAAPQSAEEYAEEDYRDFMKRRSESGKTYFNGLHDKYIKLRTTTDINEFAKQTQIENLIEKSQSSNMNYHTCVASVDNFIPCMLANALQDRGASDEAMELS
mmetsp:Transcript_21256/g.70521  ORF Transcript_21256/g.70521 Transcript_21256/m.70521 type:complete len:107 (+) Transcript_21256:2026-2346(+)